MQDNTRILKVGDRVRVVNYGHLIMGTGSLLEQFKRVSPGCYDLTPEIVGKEGTVDIVSESGTYAVNLDEQSKHAWYDRDQLELIQAPPKEILATAVDYQPLSQGAYDSELNKFTHDEMAMWKQDSTGKVEPYDGGRDLGYIGDEVGIYGKMLVPERDGINWAEFTRNLPALRAILAYCKEAGIQPADLVTCHKLVMQEHR